MDLERIQRKLQQRPARAPFDGIPARNSLAPARAGEITMRKIPRFSPRNNGSRIIATFFR
jgi:hypothetical protein